MKNKSSCAFVASGKFLILVTYGMPCYTIDNHMFFFLSSVLLTGGHATPLVTRYFFIFVNLLFLGYFAMSTAQSLDLTSSKGLSQFRNLPQLLFVACFSNVFCFFIFFCFALDYFTAVLHVYEGAFYPQVFFTLHAFSIFQPQQFYLKSCCGVMSCSKHNS